MLKKFDQKFLIQMNGEFNPELCVVLSAILKLACFDEILFLSWIGF